MNILLDAEPNTISAQDSPKEVSSSSNLKQVEPISFRQCFRHSDRSLKVQSSRSGYSWNRVLSKVHNHSQSLEGAVPQKEKKSYERREFPRHTSEAIVLTLGDDGQGDFIDGDPPGNKGYVINVSQNGISYASKSQFHLRDELHLHVEDQSVKFALHVTALVVRATPLDDQFWRIDCKLLSPLSDQQITGLKEHASSCYAG
jgi:hypothetical protein